MEDLKSQDTDLAMEVSKIKAVQGKLAKKLRGQDKDKTTDPKQKAKATAVLTFVLFLGLACFRLMEEDLKISKEIIANQTNQIEALLFEKTMLEKTLDLLNKTTVEVPREFDSEPDNTWETLKVILMGILASILAV